ncbi:MAG TPA: glycosyltransferase [Candidatus Paceibacterota bacterium]|nr:glycosyltransferase [Candidatus Paceibacterota bacterium]
MKATAATYAPARPRTPRLDDRTFRAILLGAGIVILFILALVKSEAWADFWAAPIIFVYTILVTTFELSRVLGAIIYGNISSKAVPSTATVRYQPKVSFVIPCKNEEGAIAHSIEQCFAADYPKELLEVIVINDGSTDGTRDVLYETQKKYPELIIVDWKENRGKRHGMAEGFRRATGEIVVQLDSDSYIDPKTFPELIAPFADHTIGAVCAHADPANADQNFLTKMQAAYYFLSFRILKAAESAFFTVFCCSGCSSAYRRSTIIPILDTWLSERFLGLPVTWGDDRALTNWVLRQGQRTIYTDRVQAYTICPDNLKQLLKQQARWKKGWLVNSIFASKFILKREPFIALTYFFPLVVITLMTPFMAALALIIYPLLTGTVPVFYIAGVFLITTIIALYYRYVARDNAYWPYLFAWSTLNLAVLSFMLFYALATIQNRAWGTR